MSEPLTTASALKGMATAIQAVWDRGAILLWCLTVVGGVVLVALALGSFWHFGDADLLFAKFGFRVAIATLALAVLSIFKTYSERNARPIVLLPREQRSHWGQARQPSGEVYTFFALDFQVTNVSDHSVMLSAVRLSKPRIRRRSVLQSLLMTRHPVGETYGSEHPVLAHSLSYGTAHVTVDHPVGRTGKPMRVVIGVQDHVGRWHRLVFKHVRSMP